MAATECLSENTDHAVREVMEEALRLDGPKRGLHRAARLLGVSERWLRGFRYGEPARVSAKTYLRALDARRLLRAERRARLVAELAALELPHEDLAGDPCRMGGAVDGGSLAGRGGLAGAPGARVAALSD